MEGILMAARRDPENKRNSKKNNTNSKSTKRSNKSGNKKSETIQLEQETVFDEERLARSKRIKDEIVAVIVIAVGLFLALAFQTTLAGEFGKVLGEVFKGIFGFTAYLLPYYFILGGVLIFSKKMIHIGPKAIILTAIIYLMLSIVNAGRYINASDMNFSLLKITYYYNNGINLDDGGVFGMCVGGLIVKTIGIAGLYILAVLVIFICLLLVIDTPVSRMIENAKIKKAEMAAHHAERMAEKERIAEERRQHLEVERMLAQDRQEREAKERDRRFFGIGTNRNTVSIDDGHQSNKRKIMSLVASENFSDTDTYEPIIDEPLPDEYGQFGMDLEYDYTPQPIDTDDFYGLGENSYWNSGNLDDIVIDDSNSGRNKKKKKAKVGSVSSNKKTPIEPESEIETIPDEKLETIPQETAPFVPDKQTSKGPIIVGGINETNGVDASDADASNAKEITPVLSQKEAASSMLKEDELNKATVTDYEFPPVSLLKENKSRGKSGDSDAALRKKAEKLENVLHSFNIDADVTNVTQGPTVTRYEVHPNSGVKVKGIKSLADDIALNMEAKSIRIEAPIPGKPAVGIEIENNKINMVSIREIIDSKAFRDAKSKISFAVGKDISGNEIVADLKSMPHLLIAGSTGSGKSVCINSIITSFIYKANPDEVKLVLVDPKVVELANYNGIPHLLIPVVTDPAKAAAALNWAVAEMDDRYRKFANEGARELSSYNDHMRSQGRDEEVMPQVVIIIDELADLMMAAPSQVEDSICRLAQKARAAGMHLIVATQRPSVDVITGVIKANIPSRIAFAVSSQVDSRTILDMAGAEKLVGKGDMLFNPLGTGKPLRVQGTFISDEEVNSVIDFVKTQTEEPEYAEKVIDRIERANTSSNGSDDKPPEDELLPDAIEHVVHAQQASVSMLQRRFRIGYNRAARIVDEMEERQIVGPQDGSRPRQVLITEEELKEIKEATEDIEN